MPIENRTLTTGDRFVATYRKERFVALYDQLEPKKPFTLDEGPRLVGDRFSTLSDAGKKIMNGIACNGWHWWTRAEEKEIKTGPDPRPASERFWEKVDKNGPIPEFRPELGPCWIWIGALDTHGYGNFCVEHNRTKGTNRYEKAYKFAFLEETPLAEGYEPDHLCRVHACVRRSHMEAVTRKENLRRGAGNGGVLVDGKRAPRPAAPAPKTPRAKITRIPKPKTGIADGGLRQVVEKPAPTKAVKPTPIGKPRAARRPKAPSFPMHDACGLGHDPDIDCQTEQRAEQELDTNMPPWGPGPDCQCPDGDGAEHQTGCPDASA